MFTRRMLSYGVQGNQDGGPNGYGTVIELREWKGEPSRLKFGVRVLWDSGGANTYRWGAEDAWDVQVEGQVDSGVDLRALRDSVPRVSPPPPALCLHEEVAALRALYMSTGGPQWRSRTGWSVFDAPPAPLTSTNDPCRTPWDGLMCLDGHVVAL